MPNTQRAKQSASGNPMTRIRPIVASMMNSPARMASFWSPGYKACSLSGKPLNTPQCTGRGVSPQPSIQIHLPLVILAHRPIAARHDIHPAMRALPMPMHPDKLFWLAAGRTTRQRGCGCVDILLMPVCAHLSLASCLPLTCAVIWHSTSDIPHLPYPIWQSLPSIPYIAGPHKRWCALARWQSAHGSSGVQQINQFSAVIASIGLRDSAPNMGGDIILHNALAIAIHHTQSELRFSIKQQRQEQWQNPSRHHTVNL